MPKFAHLMLDTETMSLNSRNAAIVQVAIVPFNMTGEDFSEYIDIRIRASAYAELSSQYHIDQKTIEWWETQDPTVRASVFSGELFPAAAMSVVNEALRTWDRCGIIDLATVKLWARDPDFDCSILKHAMETEGEGWPFKYNNLRAVRTQCNDLPDWVFDDVPKNLVKHDALEDCKYQIRQVQAAHNVMQLGLDMLQDMRNPVQGMTGSIDGLILPSDYFPGAKS